MPKRKVFVKVTMTGATYVAGKPDSHTYDLHVTILSPDKPQMKISCGDLIILDLDSIAVLNHLKGLSPQAIQSFIEGQKTQR